MNTSHGNKCIVADCRETGNAGFFTLPKNNEKRKKWLEGIKAEDWFWAVTSEDRIKDRLESYSSRLLEARNEIVY